MIREDLPYPAGGELGRRSRDIGMQGQTRGAEIIPIRRPVVNFCARRTCEPGLLLRKTEEDMKFLITSVVIRSGMMVGPESHVIFPTTRDRPGRLHASQNQQAGYPGDPVYKAGRFGSSQRVSTSLRTCGSGLLQAHPVKLSSWNVGTSRHADAKCYRSLIPGISL